MAVAAGAQVVRSEIVGLVPAAALAGVDPAELKLEAFSPDLLLEERLAQALRDRPGHVPRTPPAGVRQ
jgi:glutamate formiminotransferase